MDKYSLILTDADGTLLDSSGTLSSNTKYILKRLRTRGVPLVLTSGKAPCDVERVARKAKISAPVVCYDGALVLDENRSILADTGIEAQLALAFKTFVNTRFPEISFNSFLYDIWLADRPEDLQTRRLAERYPCEPLGGELSAALRLSKHAHKFLCAGPWRSLRALEESAKAAFPALEPTLSGMHCLEVARRGVSRQTALRTLCRHYGVEPGRVVVIGNARADVDILREAGIGIAMDGAPESVRNAADRVTAGCDEDGFYIALKGLRFQPPGQ